MLKNVSGLRRIVTLEGINLQDEETALGGFATARFGPSPVIMVGAGLLLLSMLIGHTSRDLRDL